MNPTTKQRMILNALRPGPLHVPQGVQGGIGPIIHGRLNLNRKVPTVQQIMQAKVKIGQ
jgi:hypothetical protein